MGSTYGAPIAGSTHRSDRQGRDYADLPANVKPARHRKLRRGGRVHRELGC